MASRAQSAAAVAAAAPWSSSSSRALSRDAANAPAPQPCSSSLVPPQLRAEPPPAPPYAPPGPAAASAAQRPAPGSPPPAEPPPRCQPRCDAGSSARELPPLQRPPGVRGGRASAGRAAELSVRRREISPLRRWNDCPPGRHSSEDLLRSLPPVLNPTNARKRVASVPPASAPSPQLLPGLSWSRAAAAKNVLLGTPGGSGWR